MRSVRRVGEAGTHPTSTDHVSGLIQTASNGETVGNNNNQVNSLHMINNLMLNLMSKLPISLPAPALNTV